jgi:glycosyltransferase involved in cell wall biosynthesis
MPNVRIRAVDPAAASPLPLVNWANRRWRSGAVQLDRDREIGSAAVAAFETRAPRACYTFTQVGLEPLRWAKQHGIPTVLESPNGHLRRFREICEREAARWCGGSFTGHPAMEMVERVEEEYALADRIRVSSDWARQSLIESGVEAAKITVLQQPVDLERFRPALRRHDGDTVRACFVGSLDLRKGFPYLLEAMAAVKALPLSLHFVGATGDRCSRQILERLRGGLPITDAPGDPTPSLAAADFFVLPTLEDGSPFAVAEAMASALPVVTTTATGAAEWVTPDRSGWVVPPADSSALADALAHAVAERGRLAHMGLVARADTERRAGPSCDAAVCEWFEAAS